MTLPAVRAREASLLAGRVELGIAEPYRSEGIVADGMHHQRRAEWIRARASIRERAPLSG